MKKNILNRKTKKDLLSHIENLQLRIENDHLETQNANREMQNILAKYKEGTPENKLDKVRSSAGILRRNIFKMKLSSEDRVRVIKEVDLFIDKI